MVALQAMMSCQMYLYSNPEAPCCAYRHEKPPGWHEHVPCRPPSTATAAYSAHTQISCSCKGTAQIACSLTLPGKPMLVMLQPGQMLPSDRT